jgi:hypothetical protein
VPSHAVTNAGTFAVQATLAAETTKVIGTVNQGTSPWVVTGGGGGTQFAEDVAHTTGDVGTLALAVSNEANTARAADGDYVPIATDTEGNVRMVGNRDHDAVDAGEPVKIGGKATTAEPTAVANADRVNAYFDEKGYQYNKISNNIVLVSGSVTRPADTAAYAIGDVIANATSGAAVFSISGCARQNGGSGTILKVQLIDSFRRATSYGFRLYILDTTFTPDNDNTPLTLTDAELESTVGIVTFAGGVTGGTIANPVVPSATVTGGFPGDLVSITSEGSNVLQHGIFQGSSTIPFKCGASSTSLFLVLCVGSTPNNQASAEKFTIRLSILQD